MARVDPLTGKIPTHITLAMDRESVEQYCAERVAARMDAEKDKVQTSLSEIILAELVFTEQARRKAIAKLESRCEICGEISTAHYCWENSEIHDDKFTPEEQP